MHNVYPFIFIGIGWVGVTGFTVYAQPAMDAGVSVESLARSLASGAAPGTSISEAMQGVVGQLTETTVAAEPILEGPLILEREVSEVNKTTIEAIDSRTKRYPPRLRINLTEFPLRSLTNMNHPNNEHSVQRDVPTEMIVQRIQDRLRVPQFSLTVEDRTAIISGKVATQRQRSLIESMLRFEPGISTVQNEITIVSDSM